MVRKRLKGRWTSGTQEVPISCGFFGFSGKRFTLAFGEPITIAATGQIDGAANGGQPPLPLARRASG
jgi:hypothetical protein